MAIEQAVILCGGKGERLGKLASGLPKPLVPVAGRPLLDRTLEFLAVQGMRRVLLAAGHLGEAIADYVTERGAYGMGAKVVIEDVPRGTAGALTALVKNLDLSFALIYGDILLDFDFRAMLQAHERQAEEPLATLLVRESDHPWDSHLVVANEAGEIQEFAAQRQPGRRYVNCASAAVYVCSRSLMEYVPATGATDFGQNVFPAILADGGKLRTHRLERGGYVKDMGTPERLQSVERHLARKGRVERARGKTPPARTVFLDRDGTLNRDVGLVTNPDQLELLPGAAAAVALLKQSGLHCFLATNQPVLARGLCDEEALGAIHAKLEAALASKGAHLDGIYFCPHHPETHHAEGFSPLRRACECRKPAPGMILDAVEEHGLDLASCVMVGDHERDILAGRAAGIRTVHVGPSDSPAAHLANLSAPDVLAAARAILARWT